MTLNDEYYDDYMILDDFSDREHCLTENYEMERLGLFVDYPTKISEQKKLAYKMFGNKLSKLVYDPELTDRSGW